MLRNKNGIGVMNGWAIAIALIAVVAWAAPARAQQSQPESPHSQPQSPESQPATQPPDEIIFREALVIDRVVQYGRAAVHADAIEAKIVAGTWSAPKAGDVVTLSDSSTHTWTAATAGDDGWLNHAALGGGYALFTIQSPQDRIMLLKAQGHNCVYVNGELRTGDPYALGFVALPVHLRQGSNEFLFQCTRGRVAARLVPPKAPVQLWNGDMTLPDIIAGQPIDAWGSIVVINATDQTVKYLAITSMPANLSPLTVDVPAILPMTVRKVTFHLQAAAIPPPPDGPTKLDVRLELLEKTPEANRTIETIDFSLGICQPNQLHNRTFVSDIDGSVQYYAVRPAIPVVADPATSQPQPGLILTLHGASVEAAGQAAAYQSKPWCHIVAPTNRRPFGFDWEDWGRLDAMEVLALARNEFKPDPLRTYLTGHSMGGHGTWQLGATFPDQFAAIGPSAGWISFWSYSGGAARFEHPNPVQEMLQRATNPSDTLALSRNYLRHGIYILHGDLDDNVPVDQARTMRKHLAGYHADFSYYERPGAGHWWGDACVDWPPMMQFFQQHVQSDLKDRNHIEFCTANPGVSASCDWASIDSQTQSMMLSSIDIRRDIAKRAFVGTTVNVSRLSLALSNLEPGSAISVEFDKQKIENIPWPSAGDRIWLARAGEAWAVIERPAASLKGPHRSGPFKDAFRHRMMFVYGTKGSPEENAWSINKARYDAETFWYRGNGSIELVADVEFDAAKEPNRGVIIYGNADTNAAWKALLGESPVQVKRGTMTIGERDIIGEDLACLFIRPRPGSDAACVAAVSGNGLVGMRLTDRLPYFVSGVAYPDCTVIGAEALTRGVEGVRVAGFFGADWAVNTGEFAWRDPATPATSGPATQPDIGATTSPAQAP